MSRSGRDQAFFELFREAGENCLRSATLLNEMIEKWPDEHESMAREVFRAEQEGDRLTHEIVSRLNMTNAPPLERGDVYALATRIDDIVDYIEETADHFVLYNVEAPMEQALEMSRVLVRSCEQVAGALADLGDLDSLERYWIEIHRLENDGDRISRDAVASLFANGIDPMVVIRWKDIFDLLEEAIDATETVAHVIEGVVIKQSRPRRFALLRGGG